MSEFLCPFCGSDKLFVETPFMKRSKVWPMEPEVVKSFCCRSQEKNNEYINKKFGNGKGPKLEDVSSL